MKCSTSQLHQTAKLELHALVWKEMSMSVITIFSMRKLEDSLMIILFNLNNKSNQNMGNLLLKIYQKIQQSTSKLLIVMLSTSSV
jgi:hypothetical protein